MHETLREIKQILAEMRASSSTKDKAGTAISTEQEDESVSEHLLNQEALERLKKKEREYFAERGSRSHSKTPSREEHRPSRESSPATSIGNQRDAEPRAPRSKKGKKRHVDSPSNTQEDPPDTRRPPEVIEDITPRILSIHQYILLRLVPTPLLMGGHILLTINHTHHSRIRTLAPHMAVIRFHLQLVVLQYTTKIRATLPTQI